MIADLRFLPLIFAVSAGLAVGACKEEKQASAPADKPAAESTAAVAAAKDDAKGVAAKVEAATEAVKDAAGSVAAKVEAATATATEAVKDAASNVAAKVEAAKETAKEAAKDVAADMSAKVDTAKAAVAAAATSADAKVAEAVTPAKPADAAPAAAAPEAKTAEAAPAAAAAAPAADASAAANPVGEFAKTIEGVAFKDARYRTKEGTPVPVVTKDYQVDWATWQGFRRYHDACHVCHGPNALGSTFAPSLAESLKTMDYETFYGTVVGGRIRDEAGTKYVMPAFGEDKNIMCYLDDIYSYIKARSINSASDGKQGMPPGRPNGREDISAEAKKNAADCTG